MKRVLLVIALASGSAMAQDTADWGGTGCRLIPVTGKAHVAEVLCQNVTTAGNAVTEGAMTAGGLTVGLIVLHQPGDLPDEFTIIPPPGYFAKPPTMSLREHTQGVVLVLPWVGY